MSTPNSKQNQWLNAIGAVDNQSLRQQIAGALQQAILDGELRPGEAIVESDVAQRLGVSRAPVREALQILAHSDLVETIPYRGTIVRRLVLRDIVEVYSLRTALESFALQRAMERDNDGLSIALRASCDIMLELAKARNWSALADEDGRFHELLVSHADHRLLMQAWRDLYLKVRQVMALRNLQNDDSVAIYDNHVQIVEAVEQGHIAAALDGLKAHIATAADLILDQGDQNT